MPDSSRPLTHIARDAADHVIAEVGWWGALRWSLGLLTSVKSPADLRDVALILAAVVLA